MTAGRERLGLCRRAEGSWIRDIQEKPANAYPVSLRLLYQTPKPPHLSLNEAWWLISNVAAGWLYVTLVFSDPWRNVRMQKPQGGSWVKIGVATTLLCVCFGVAYGLRLAKQEEQARYKQAWDFNFGQHYSRLRHSPARSSSDDSDDWLPPGYRRSVDLNSMRTVYISGSPRSRRHGSETNSGGTR